MALRKVQDISRRGVEFFTDLSDVPGSITANTYLRGNAAGTALEYSNILPFGVGWYFIDTNAGLLSVSSGSLIMGATGTFTMLAAIVDVSTGQFYANSGMLVGAPSAGNRVTGFAVEVSDLPGVYFRNSAPNDGGWITMENGPGPSIPHRFGVNGTPYLGDVRHTDTTRYFRWDASANLLTLESADGTIVHGINGAGETVFNEQGSDLDFRIESDGDTEIFFVDGGNNRVGISTTSPSDTLTVSGDFLVSGEMKGARVIESAGTRNILSGTTSGYLGGPTFTMSSTIGYVMPRAGSIVGLSGLVSASLHAGTGNMTFEIRKNNTVVFSAAVSVTGNGVFTVVSTQARGTDTFSASDLIQLSWTNAGTYAKDNIVLSAELQFDT